MARAPSFCKACAQESRTSAEREALAGDQAVYGAPPADDYSAGAADPALGAYEAAERAARRLGNRRNNRRGGRRSGRRGF